jgi:signal transduction histidine kinase
MIIAAHDGELWHDVDVSRGATFHFKLPVPLAKGAYAKNTDRYEAMGNYLA